MGTRIYNQNQHKNFQQRHGNPTASPSTTKIFLPTLCRLSVKDTIAPHPRSICPKKNDPSSPKVSCMGQVKRQHHHHHHHHLTPSSTTVKPHHNSFSRNNKCVQTMIDHRRRKQLPTKFTNSSSNGHENSKCGAIVPVLNLAELDPPLPVIKRLPPQPSDRKPVSLWKRRSREEGQLTNIQIPTFHSTFSLQKSLQFEPPISV